MGSGSCEYHKFENCKSCIFIDTYILSKYLIPSIHIYYVCKYIFIDGYTDILTKLYQCICINLVLYHTTILPIIFLLCFENSSPLSHICASIREMISMYSLTTVSIPNAEVYGYIFYHRVINICFSSNDRETRVSNIGNPFP